MSCRKTIFADKQGAGLVMTIGEEDLHIEPKSITLKGDVLVAGQMTDLFGRFSRQLRFAGVLKQDSETMCFHIGETLLESFYSTYFKIDENEIATNFTFNSARNYIWKNNSWK